jgi:Ca2+-binding EF-hand superfamily protein
MKPMIALLAFAALPTTVLAAPPASQAEAAKAFEARFTLADTDRSGGLTKNELAGAAAPGFPVILKNFEAMDANKDGQVTLAERNGAINAFLQKRQAEQAQAITKARKDLEDRFAKADTNKDGALSKKEVDGAAAPGFPIMKKNFDAMDKDKNGKVSFVERENFLKEEVKRQMDARQAEAQKNFEALFSAADTNKSGGLSKKEVDSAQPPGFPLIKQNFDAMDTDRNGQVTVAERNSFVSKKR